MDNQPINDKNVTDTYEDLEYQVNSATEDTKPQVNIEVVVASEIRQEAFRAGLLQGASNRVQQMIQILQEKSEKASDKDELYKSLKETMFELLADDEKHIENEEALRKGETTSPEAP